MVSAPGGAGVHPKVTRRCNLSGVSVINAYCGPCTQDLGQAALAMPVGISTIGASPSLDGVPNFGIRSQRVLEILGSAFGI